MFRAALLTLSLAACGHSQAPAPGQAPAPAQAPAPVPAAAAVPAPAKPRVKIATNFGVMVIELEPAAAPATVANFLRYLKEGHYKGTVFHRVVPNFMIQGGGLTEDLTEKPVHAPIPNEAESAAKAGLKNVKGTVVMARTDDPNSATAQFFINVIDNAYLDPSPGNPGYCVFGRVVEGMPVVEAISRVHTIWRKGTPNVPDFAVRIKDVVLLEDAAPAAK
ncbi:MAG TPA: peptidylprolyl isomerase [Holophagaceae bacterium]|nr:peptidylprolyl isomerase [Holophagaceae bacterium]